MRKQDLQGYADANTKPGIKCCICNHVFEAGDTIRWHAVGDSVEDAFGSGLQPRTIHVTCTSCEDEAKGVAASEGVDHYRMLFIRIAKAKKKSEAA